MLADHQVKAIFRNAYNLFEKYKNVGECGIKWDDIVSEIAKISNDENKSELQTKMLISVFDELEQRACRLD